VSNIHPDDRDERSRSGSVNIYGDVTGRDKIASGLTPPSITPPATPPLELSIRFGKPSLDAEDALLPVSVHVERLGLSAGPFDFAVPLDDKVLADLHWYLELYPQWPVGPDYDRALGIEARLRDWGKRLFDTVFAHRDMLRVYDEFRRAEASGHLITIDATDARVLRLPWLIMHTPNASSGNSRRTADPTAVIPATVCGWMLGATG